MMPIAKRERANGPARGARASAASAGVHVDPVCVQRGGTSDNHEKADDSAQHGSNDEVDALVPQVGPRNHNVT